MGTRSETFIYDGNTPILRIYRQFDGYPEGQGVDLARLCNVKIVNGLSGFDKEASKRTTANGMSELAAMVLAGLKKDSPVGNIYVEDPTAEPGAWVEYVYIIRGREGEYPTIECGTHTSKEEGGSWPFNLQTEDNHIFTGTAKQWLAKYAKKGKKVA